jgi:AcrR family transcriptional regulator
VARSDARRQDILDATLACYSELGWAATTIADIREASGASTGSIYHHYQSKEGIGAALYAELLRRYRERLLERLERTRTARSFVRALVHHHLDWAAEHPNWARYLNDMRSHESLAGNEAQLRDASRELHDLINARLDTYVEAGDIIKMPRTLYPSIIVGPAHDLIRRWIREPQRFNLSEAKAPLANIAWRAITAE